MPTVKAKLLPKIPVTGMLGFLAWARRDSPALYAGLVQNIPEVALFERTMQEQGEGLGDWTDIFASIGSAVGSAASSIGSFVATNGNSLLQAATGIYGVTQASKLANTQLQLAQANRPPVQTAVTQTPYGPQVLPAYPIQAQPVAYPGATNYPATYVPAAAPTWIPGVPNWVPIAAAAGLVAVFFASKMR